jgi:hypothetical protein
LFVVLGVCKGRIDVICGVFLRVLSFSKRDCGHNYNYPKPKPNKFRMSEFQKEKYKKKKKCLRDRAGLVKTFTQKTIRKTEQKTTVAKMHIRHEDFDNISLLLDGDSAIMCTVHKFPVLRQHPIQTLFLRQISL